MASYSYPAGLPNPIDASFDRTESAYIIDSQPHSGTPFYSITNDDAPMSFGLVWRFTQNQMIEFREWLEADNFAVLNGAQFNINLPTDTGIIIQTASFLPDSAPRIDGIEGLIYTVSATVVARDYSESIPSISFKTPDNEFSYYFFSQYEWPDILPFPIDATYRKTEAQRFLLGSVSAGAHVSEILSDDSPVTYDVSFVIPRNLEPIFRAWLAQDDFNMLKGAPFNLPLVTEYGVILQVVSFVIDSQPQQVEMTAGTKTFAAQVIARKQMDSPDGLDDVTLGPRVFVSQLYPFFFEESVAGTSSFGGGELKEFVINYTYPAEQVDGAAVFGGGVLDEIVKEYGYTEQVDGAAVFGGGGIISIHYGDWPDEQVDGGATFGGGEFPAISYTNWPSEQVNSTAIFAGGTLG